MRMITLSLPLVLLAFSALPAETIHVPDDYPLIQVAIFFSADGDTVLVENGTYTGNGNRDIDLLGRRIILLSENGPDSCIIDCEGGIFDEHRGFTFHSGEDTSTVLSGFTIKNGYMYGTEGEAQGGGILCDASSPKIEGNLIRDNSTWGGGGGVCCTNGASPVIADNTIHYNTGFFPGGFYTGGGGISCHEASHPVIRDNVLTENIGLGGAIACMDASCPSITGNTISENGGFEVGGGIYLFESAPVIEGNSIILNNAGFGGGIACDWHSSPIIKDNEITMNFAGTNGGGIFCRDESNPIIMGNTISGNEGYDGGGIFLKYASPIIMNNTVTENETSLLEPYYGYGGGIYSYWYSSPTIIGNTICGNRAREGAGLNCHYHDSSTVYGNIIAGNSAYLRGGGVLCKDTDSYFDGNTIAGNIADEGGGLYALQNSLVTITNSIMWGDTALVGSEICLEGDSPSTVSISYSDVMWGQDSVWVDTTGVLEWGDGMIDSVPLFVSPGGDNYQLQSGSPCIDAGDPDIPCKPWGGWRLDMGACEYDMGFYYDGRNLIRKPVPIERPVKR